MSRTEHRRWRLILGSVALTGSVALAGFVASRPALGEDEAYSPFNGKQTYKTLCMNCHGLEGKGDGYLVSSLNVRPTDLTTLAKDNGGNYPADRVAASIDGRKQVTGHGQREMPVWGDVLAWTEQDSAERQALVKRKIGELVEYIRTLQTVEPPKS
jgi:mono/diheme cytochrome c family protein